MRIVDARRGARPKRNTVRSRWTREYARLMKAEFHHSIHMIYLFIPFPCDARRTNSMRYEACRVSADEEEVHLIQKARVYSSTHRHTDNHEK